jgi:2-haloacid dehalogenase
MSAAPFADTRAFVFDAYGTLLDFADAVRVAGTGLGAKAAPLVDLWRQKQIGYTWHRSLTGQHADFETVTRQALEWSLADLGIKEAGIAVRLMAAYDTLAAFDDATPALSALRVGGRATAVLSNGTPRMLAAAFDAAGLTPLLDPILSIESAGIFKPHPATYRLACTALAAEPGEIAFVSGNPWDCAGAAIFGFRVIWLDRNGGRKEALPGEAEVRISTLAELPALAGLPHVA